MRRRHIRRITCLPPQPHHVRQVLSLQWWLCPTRATQRRCPSPTTATAAAAGPACTRSSTCSTGSTSTAGTSSGPAPARPGSSPDQSAHSDSTAADIAATCARCGTSSWPVGSAARSAGSSRAACPSAGPAARGASGRRWWPADIAPQPVAAATATAPGVSSGCVPSAHRQRRAGPAPQPGPVRSASQSA